MVHEASIVIGDAVIGEIAIPTSDERLFYSQEVISRNPRSSKVYCGGHRRSRELIGFKIEENVMAYGTICYFCGPVSIKPLPYRDQCRVNPKMYQEVPEELESSPSPDSATQIEVSVLETSELAAT